MSGNTFGKAFTVTTFGESHGPAIGGVIDGCPPGLAIDIGDIQPELDRRKPGSSRFTTQRKELDEVEILSGTFEGITTGAPIGLLIKNVDHKTKDYSKIKNLFRPSHADYTYQQKYGLRDYRGGGRSSARETAMRVAAGAIAKKWLLSKQGVVIKGHLIAIGELEATELDWNLVNKNPFFCGDAGLLPKIESLMQSVRKEGDSVGAKLRIVADGTPAGWGEPVFDRLDADLAYAMMGINAVKGVEIGAGFDVVKQKGSEHRDELAPQGFKSNHAGGVLGGISSGQQITVKIALKPTSSIVIPGDSIDLAGNPTKVVTGGRHDPCVGLRAVPIAEAMMALVLMDHALRHRGQNADVVSNTPNIPAGTSEY